MATMGRPRTFDRDKAVEQAMFLFWQHGYESTSLSQLKAGIANGITAPSFYAAFGSKEALFHECVQRYLATYAQVTEPLWNDALSAREAVEITLRESAKMQCSADHPKGCMVSLGIMSATSAEHESVVAPLTESRERTRAGLQHCVQRAISNGELRADTHADALATVFNAFLLGLATLARDGVSEADMQASITQMLAIWDAHRALPQ